MYTVTIENNGVQTVIHDGSAPNSSPMKIKDGKIGNIVGAIGSFVFNIYKNNPGYSLLFGRTTNITVVRNRDGKKMFQGRVLIPEDSMDETGRFCKKVTCEDRRGWLRDTIQPYQVYTVDSTEAVISNFLGVHNAAVDESRRIYLGQVTVNAQNNYRYVKNYDTTYETINDKLIDRFGGELQIRDGDDGKVYLDYLERIGSGTDTVIELAVNMKSITRTVDGTAIVTRFYPLGARIGDEGERVTIASVNGGLPYLENRELISQFGGVYAGKEIWDDVTTPEALLAKARERFAGMNKISTQYVVSALDLSQAGYDFEEFELGNIYRVKNLRMEPAVNDDLRLIGIIIDLEKPWLSKLTFGEKFATLTSLQVKKAANFDTKLADLEFRTSDAINDKVANATALITGAKGGHVILDPSENPYRILIMDTASIDTATSCIQFNQNGIGFWSQERDGGSAEEGPYTTAWTIDGTFIADFIGAGVLKGVRIECDNGSIAGWEVTSDSFTSPDGSVSLQSTNVVAETTNAWLRSQGYTNKSLRSYTNRQMRYLKSRKVGVSQISCTDGDSKMAIRSAGINFFSGDTLITKIDTNGLNFFDPETGKFVGHIAQIGWDGTDKKGMQFGLGYEAGDFMSWAVQEDKDGLFYTRLMYERASDSFSIGGTKADFSGAIHANGGILVPNGCDINFYSVLRMNGWPIYDSQLETTSDMALKDNILPTKVENALDIVNNINIVEFDWYTGGHEDIGFLANQVAEICPDLTGERGGYKTVKESRILRYLMKAMQELSAKVNYLEKEVRKWQQG